MQTIILTLHVIVALAIIVLVLLQQGKGADAGAAFGSGASATMFGSQGATPFLVKLTSVLAATFFATSLSLSYMSAHKTRPEDELMKAVTGADKNGGQTQQHSPAPKGSKPTRGVNN